MWPFKKKKGITLAQRITLAPGESVGITLGLVQWRRDKDEVIITTKDGPILLDGNNKLFITIGTVTLQIVPDFKNRVLDFVEVIDPNTPHTDNPEVEVEINIGTKDVSFGNFLKEWDNEIERYGKKVKEYRLVRNIFIPANILIAIFNIYQFIVRANMIRYVNLSIAFLAIYMVYRLWDIDKKFHDSYKKYKDERENAFGIVKRS